MGREEENMIAITYKISEGVIGANLYKQINIPEKLPRPLWSIIWPWYKDKYNIKSIFQLEGKYE